MHANNTVDFRVRVLLGDTVVTVTGTYPDITGHDTGRAGSADHTADGQTAAVAVFGGRRRA